LNNLKWCDWNI